MFLRPDLNPQPSGFHHRAHTQTINACLPNFANDMGKSPISQTNYGNLNIIVACGRLQSGFMNINVVVTRCQ